MHLSVEELFNYTDEERQRWERWFQSLGDELLAMPVPGERESTVGGMIMYIFGPELRFVERLRKESPTDYRALPASSVETVFGFGLKSRQKMRDYVDSLSAPGWEHIVELDLPGGPSSASIRKIVLHTLIHEVRHWALIERLVRECGLIPPAHHDLLTSRALT